MQDVFTDTFLHGNATTTNINDIAIANPGDDEFTLSLDGVISNNVAVKYRPACVKLNNSWIGPVSGASWHQSGNNWSLGEIPDLCNHVIIPTGHDINIETGQVAYGYTLTVELGADLAIDANAELLVITD